MRPRPPPRPQLAALLAAAGCAAGCAPAPPPAAPRPAVAAAAPPVVVAPRCPPAAAREPLDARTKMIKLGTDVRGCYLLGHAADLEATIVVDVSIVEDGSVQAASVVSAPAGKESAARCVEQALRRATFAAHCGDAVDIRWTYSLRGG